MKLLYLVTICGFIGLGCTNEIYSPGPFEVSHKLYLSLFTWGLDHNLDVWAPAAEGNFPVIYFIPGLTGVIPSEVYYNVLSRLSSHGYIVLGIWTLTALPTTQVEATWLKEIDIWLQENLNDKLIGDDFNPNLVIDFSKIYLMAHSSGNHITVNYINTLDNGCDNIRGLILLSPVDGIDPFGLIDNYCIEPGQKLKFETPTLLMSVGLDQLPGIGEPGTIYPACAPEELSNLRFWNALNGAAWHINATMYGHADILMEFLADDVMGFLRFCAYGGAPVSVYHDFVSGEILAFLKGIEGDCEVLKYLEDSSLMPVQTVTAKQEGDQPVCQTGGFCIKY